MMVVLEGGVVDSTPHNCTITFFRSEIHNALSILTVTVCRETEKLRDQPYDVGRYSLKLKDTLIQRIVLPLFIFSTLVCDLTTLPLSFKSISLIKHEKLFFKIIKYNIHKEKYTYSIA